MKTDNEPTLSPGETHIATIHIPGQQAYHLILLPWDAEDVTHEAATEWAASIGGELPNRHEQALLFAHHRDQFKGDWYWSAARHESAQDYAWEQGFGKGHQGITHHGAGLNARAIRREPVNGASA